MNKTIDITGVSEHNLKNFDVKIEHNKITVVTGVSGSGKSSLVYDIICNEGQRRFLESYSSHARQYLKQLKRPNVTHINGLPPAISVDQKTVIRNPRSTVGTMSEIYDYLRLLYARLGKTDKRIEKKIERRLFSFNSPYGACPHCNGLGVEDQIDPGKLIEDENKSLKDRALVITAPNGYIIYSQVTMDVLNQVCNAHGFDVNIPWKDMTDEQKNIVLYGSDIIKIPFGKHTLESRMKWSGITAKPREEGYYKGIIPVMEEILHRDRNKNILRFVKTSCCSKCNGKRLGKDALSVLFQKKTIADAASMSVNELNDFFESLSFEAKEEKVGSAIQTEILKRCDLLIRLGLGYLTFDRESTSLSGGEAQRIRLANQAAVKLRGALFVLDEPSIGLHPRDNKKLLSVLDELVNNGNTVLIVEHDEETIRYADNIIDIGPKAGNKGGELLFSGPLDTFLSSEVKRSITQEFLSGKRAIPYLTKKRKGNGKSLKIQGAAHHNLKDLTVEIPLGLMNVVTGVSGAGKSSLIHDILANKLRKDLHKAAHVNIGKHKEIHGIEHVTKIIEIDQSPIGRTPRSNPATYTNLFDHIRDHYANLPVAKEKNWKKGRFSFNNVGGRCETCQGAGLQQIGMHFLGNVDVVCDDCKGKRFNEETLAALYKSKSIYDVLELSIKDACEFFSDKPRLMKYLSTMKDLGLGYITLGQPATTLSGGEAQRVKLASELSKASQGHTLYILDEPTAGLHTFDIEILLKSLNALVDEGHTVIITEHHPDIIKSADHIIDLGPGSGSLGGELVAAGNPEDIMSTERSLTGKELKAYFEKKHSKKPKKQNFDPQAPLLIKGITTHNLKHIDVSIPMNKLTVITGVSGSGKSSLAFDTIFSEGQKRYSESLSNYLRSMIKQKGDAQFDEVLGMTPAIAVDQHTGSQNPRSTLGTVTEIYDYYRLLYSRVGKSEQSENSVLSASMFSFNHEKGACETCKGLGYQFVCDPEKLISDPNLALNSGAMNRHKSGKFYGDPYGQHMAVLLTIGKLNHIDFSKSWKELNKEAQTIALYGTGDKEYKVVWEYKRKNREGKHEFNSKWKGLTALAEEEFERKHADKRGNDMLPFMKQEICTVCKGARLKEESINIKFVGNSIADLSRKSIKESLSFFKDIDLHIKDPNTLKIIDDLCNELINRLEILNDIGLGYLSIDRRTNSLSGGETRRMRLAGQIVSGLTGITYVLDEPSIGLHSSDTEKLIRLLFKLRDKGNTVIVVEHDADIISRADHIIDIGPGAGNKGGEIIACGTIDAVKSTDASLTGHYLKKPVSIPMPKRSLNEGIKIKKACANNLKEFDINIPSGGLTALTGVSGSGKSSLLFDVLFESYKQNRPVNCSAISGFDRFKKIITANQSLPGTTGTSTLATYFGFFDKIRDLFAGTDTAKEKSLKKTDFSFNKKGGRCETCKGLGQTKVSMDFLSDMWLTCDDCKGKRYQDSILEIQF